VSNRDTEAALRYHEQTKHSPYSVRVDQHYLDWSIQPRPFKLYEGLEPIQLPRDLIESESSLLSLLPRIQPEQPRSRPSLKDVAQLLFFSAGITKKKSYPGGEILFRAASCTGALYEINLYLVCAELNGLAAGVYHFDPRDFCLYCLRPGDHRQIVASACAGKESAAAASLTVISTGTYWRNAWKYRARTYRHFGWDNGTLLANLLTMCTARRLPAQLILGFLDGEINRLLDLDTDREVALSIVGVGEGEENLPAPPKVTPLGLRTLPLSEIEVDYPEMRKMHGFTLLESRQEAAEWRGDAPASVPPKKGGRIFDLDLDDFHSLSQESPERAIRRRGSSRSFTHKALSYKQFSSLLHTCAQGIPADFLGLPGSSINNWYLIVNSVEGLPAGSYFFHRQQGQIELLKEGDFRGLAGHLGLGQGLPKDASFNVFFLADLDSILHRFGNRGYRAAQLEAGILGGKLYLAAYAQGLGATGLTFFDDEVIEFFSPHAAGESAIFLMALGHGRNPRPLRL